MSVLGRRVISVPHTRPHPSDFLVIFNYRYVSNSAYFYIFHELRLFETIFTAALKVYKKQTKTDIASHPLATQLQSCDSSSAIIDMLRTQVQTVDTGSEERWTKWLDPTVNVLFAFSMTLGSGVGVVNYSYVEPARVLPSDVRYCRYSHQQTQFLLELASFFK